MQLHITGHNLELTPALKTFTEEKLKRLERHYNPISKVNVILEIENLSHIASATVSVHGLEIHAEADAIDMYSAIDALVEKLVSQLTKHKEKERDH